MLNDGQALIVEKLIEYVNSNFTFKGKYKLVFDELNTSKDSICLTTSSDSTPVEKSSDVTGTYLSGTLRLVIIHRVMKTSSGNDDLVAIDAVDDLYKFIKAHYKSLSSDTFFIDKITQVSGAKLDVVYSGGIKDFKGIFELVYERKVI